MVNGKTNVSSSNNVNYNPNSRSIAQERSEPEVLRLGFGGVQRFGEDRAYQKRYRWPK